MHAASRQAAPAATRDPRPATRGNHRSSSAAEVVAAWWRLLLLPRCDSATTDLLGQLSGEPGRGDLRFQRQQPEGPLRHWSPDAPIWSRTE